MGSVIQLALRYVPTLRAFAPPSGRVGVTVHHSDGGPSHLTCALHAYACRRILFVRMKTRDILSKVGS